MNQTHRFHNIVLRCLMLVLFCASCSAPLSPATPTNTARIRATITPLAHTTQLPTATQLPTITPPRPLVIPSRVFVPATPAQPTNQLIPPTAQSGNGPDGCTLSALAISTIITPAGVAIVPGAHLRAIWRISNTGTCVWGPGYQFISTNGDQLSSTLAISTVAATPPDQAISFQIAMIAPSNPGIYTGIWQLQASNGVLFGWFPVVLTIQQPTPTILPIAIPSRTSAPTRTNRPNPTPTSLPTRIPSPTPTRIPNPTPTRVPASIPSPTLTNTPSPTQTDTPSPTQTDTPSPTPVRDNRWGGTWSCKRSGGDACARMILSQHGGHVDGIWGATGTIHGEVSNDGQTLSGTWMINQQSGIFSMTLGANDQNWVGTSQPDNWFWCGWRLGGYIPTICAAS